MTNYNPQVLVIGDLLMDYQYWVGKYPQSGGDEEILDFAKNSGGSAANTAVALQLQNTRCALVSRVGDDEIGRELTKNLDKLGIDLSCLQVYGQTGYTITMIEPNGERTMFSFRGCKDYEPQITETMQEILKAAKVLYISGYMLQEPKQADYVIKVARQAKQTGCITMLDPSPVIGEIPKDVLADILLYTDVLLPNKNELLTLSECDNLEAGIKNLLGSVQCVVVKLGSQGSRFVAREDFSLADGSKLTSHMDCEVPADEIRAVDTTGAGDSFNAGFISAFLLGGTPKIWLKAGNEPAAKVITQKAAISHYL